MFQLVSPWMRASTTVGNQLEKETTIPKMWRSQDIKITKQFGLNTDIKKLRLQVPVSYNLSFTKSITFY